MNKYLLTLLLFIVAINAFGQFNRNSREIDKTDTLGFPVLIFSGQKIKPAEFPGGMPGFYKYISRKMKFPKDARTQKVKGKVIVEFIIDVEGNIRKESVKLTQSLLESCDKEAIRLIINSPTWTPAVVIETSKKIEMLYRMPIFFHSN